MLGGNALRLAYRPQFAVQVYYNLVCHHTLLSGSIAPSYSKKNIRKYAVNMQTCETFARQVGQLHTTKTCFAPPSFLFMFAKPLARSTYTAQLIECQKQSCAQGDSCSRRKGAQEILASSSLRNKSPTEDLSEVVSLISAEDLFSRQGARKHQRKIGLLCGVSLVGAYQGYASHVFECPGEQLL